MSEKAARCHPIPQQIVEARPSTEAETEQEVLSVRLLRRFARTVREALDGGHGRLRMDPQALADRLGPLIDLEVERLAKVRKQFLERRRTEHMLHHPPAIFGSGMKQPEGPTTEE